MTDAADDAGSPSGPLSLCWSPRDRIRRRRDFLRIQECGVRWQGRLLLVFVLAGESDRTRGGLTVSRRVGNAVTRNRVRRRIREAFRQNRALWPPQSDVVFIARAAAAEAAWTAIEDEVKRAGAWFRRRAGEVGTS